MTNEGWICTDVDLWNDLNDSDGERRELAMRVVDAAVDLAILRSGSFEDTWAEIFSRAQLRWDIVAGDEERQRAAERLSNAAEQLADLNYCCPCVRRRVAA
ncbi:MAG: hypothetical protein QM831_12945 [Kofleriaceae bacterium]